MSFREALDYRIDDIKSRRSPDHPLVEALDNGGEKRLVDVIGRLEGLTKGTYDCGQVEECYDLYGHD